MGGRAWIWVAAVILVALVITQWDEEDIERPGPVLLVGDSIFWHSADELKQQLEDDGWEVVIVAHPGAGLGGGGYTDVRWKEELDRVLAEHNPDIAVVELGTNGCVDYCESPPAAISDIMDELARVPQVLWLTVREEAPRPANARSVNRALTEAARQDGDLDLLPYQRWFEGRTGLIQPDNVHLNSRGQQHLAERVRDAVAASAE